MPKINVEIKHKLNQNDALTRIKGLLNKLKSEYGTMISDIQEDWSGNSAEFSFRAMGMFVEGTIIVESSNVTLDGKIPLAALPFKGTIEKTIIEETNKLLS